MSSKSTLTFITEEQKQICDGALLGDGCYIKPKKGKNAVFSYTSKYYNAVNFIYNKVQSFGGHIESNDIFDKRTNKTYHTNLYKSYSNELITQEYYRWYINGVKHIPKDLILTPLVCLIWYIGDGSLIQSHTSVIKIATQCFEKEEIENILLPQLKLFKAKIRISGYSKYTKKPQYAIYIPRKQISNFLNYIGECPLQEYQYKWNLNPYINKIPDNHKDLEFDICNLYKEGMPYYQIAKKYNIEPGVVRYYLIKNNLYISQKNNPFKNMLILFDENNNITKIFKDLNDASQYFNKCHSFICAVASNRKKMKNNIILKKYKQLSTEEQNIIKSYYERS